MAKTKTGKPTSEHYPIEVDGKPCKLARVTSIISAVSGGDSKTGMSYWGSMNALRFVAEELELGAFDDLWNSFKGSLYDNNKIKTRRQREGTQSHKLFEQLIRKERFTWEEDEEYWVSTAPRGEDSEELPHTVEKWDKAVARAYLELIDDLDDDDILTEVKVRWFEPGHPQLCPDDVCTHGFAGTTDFLSPEFRVMGDLKTHKGPPYFTDMLQQAFYSLAWGQMYPNFGRINHHIVLMAWEDGDFKDFHGFVTTKAVEHALGLYKEVKGEWLQ